MGENSIPSDRILGNYRDGDALQLNRLLDNDINDNEINIIQASEYFAMDNLPSVCMKNCFNVLSLNAQSINAKFDSLVILIEMAKSQSVHFQAICIQESWLSDADDLSLFQLEGYQCFSHGKQCSAHGGLLTYVDMQYNCQELALDNHSPVWENLFILIKDPSLNKDIVLGNIYRPPYENNNSRNVGQFIAELDPVLAEITKSNRFCIIAGDYNINLLQIGNKRHYNDFLDLMISHSLFPKITLPTRLGRNSCSLIDNIFCNYLPCESNYTPGILFSDISDHFPIFIGVPIGVRGKSKKKMISIRKQGQGEQESLLRDLHDIDISSMLIQTAFTDPNQNYDILHENLMKLKDKHMPVKVVKFRKHKHKDNKWISNGIIKSIKYRDKLFRILKHTEQQSPEYDRLKVNLKTYNSILKKTIREAKTSYYQNRFNSYKSNIKKTWTTINEILCKSKNKEGGIKSIIHNGERITELNRIVQIFNDFFITIGPKLLKEIRPVTKSFQSYMTANIMSSFSFALTSEDEVKKIVHSLKSKSSSGPDGISVNLLKFLAPALITPMKIIINQSLLTGIYPEKLKIAKVIPLYKKGEKHNIENFRPVSLLSSISKVFEKVAYIQLSDYFTNNKLWFDGQYGFRNEHSTELAAVELTDRIMEALDKQHIAVSIFMDLSKAFDTLDHSILLSKLKFYGITGTALEWFTSYLSNRKQYVEIEGVCSTQEIIQTGVPQGSILGPILFLIYINDIHNASDAFNYILFADDTNLISCIDPISDDNIIAKVNHINRALASVTEWMEVNKLSLNVSKTKYLVFHNIRKNIRWSDIHIKINNTELDRVHTFNFLGIIFDEHMSWKPNTDQTAQKIIKFGGILNRLKNILPTNILKIIYCSMVNSRLSYAILTWGYDYKRLEKVQKRLIRIITRSKYNSHTEPLFKFLGLLKLEDMLKLSALKFYYKHKQDSLPKYFYTFQILTHAEQHDYNTRNRGQIITQVSRTKLANKRLRIYLPKLLQTTDRLILDKVASHSLQGYSNYIKRFFIDRYSNECLIENCYICNRN